MATGDAAIANYLVIQLYAQHAVGAIERAARDAPGLDRAELQARIESLAAVVAAAEVGNAPAGPAARLDYRAAAGIYALELASRPTPIPSGG